MRDLQEFWPFIPVVVLILAHQWRGYNYSEYIIKKDASLMSHSTLLKLKNIGAILNPESDTNWGSLGKI